jgi:hypothetical protein
MAEEPRPKWMKPGLHFDPIPFATDLYRLLCIFLADSKVVKIKPEDFSRILELRGEALSGEALRILTSTAVALRIAFDQYGKEFDDLEADCGKLYPNWPAKKPVETLTLREACNKIIHAKNFHFDVSDYPRDPAEKSPVLPWLYFYGDKGGKDWRAKFSVAGYVEAGAVVFLSIAGR